MIVVDTSAIIAMLTGEDEGPSFIARAGREDAACLSPVNLLEATTVASRIGDFAASAGIDALLQIVGIEVAPLDRTHAQIARAAFFTFGKGRGHPAQLNICDCFSYALAKSLDAPLLFKGEDFTHTDIKRAM